VWESLFRKLDLDSTLGRDVVELELCAVRPLSEAYLLFDGRAVLYLEAVVLSLRDDPEDMNLSCVLRVRCSASRGFTVAATGLSR
jgi:hypothetical protein